MPNTRSARKRMRQANKRTDRNRAERSTLRTAIRKVRSASADAADAAFQTAESLLDRAARKGLIHKNAAARSKRRLRKVVAERK